MASIVAVIEEFNRLRFPWIWFQKLPMMKNPLFTEFFTRNLWS